MQQPQEQKTPGKLKILWVDDDARDLYSYSSEFRHRGFQVVTCDAYSLGLSLLKRHDFDLIVVSQGKPSFEGRCILEHARRLAPHTPVLILANHADVGVYLEAMDMGAADYFEKTPNPADLVCRIDAYLSQVNHPPGAKSPGRRSFG